MYATILVLVSLPALAVAHMSIWTPAMFGFNGPTDCDTTEGCFPGQDQVNPLKDLEFDDWWYRGPLYRSALPDTKDVAVLPAGGTWKAEMACHKDYTSFGDKTTEAGSEQDCCPGSPGLYHAHDENDNLDESQVGGCALGIADVTDPNDASMDGDNPIVIFSVQSKCVWTRETEFSIPKNMPACSGEYCICSWHWIARQDLPNNYMTGFLCKIDGATSTARWQEPQDATWCGDDSSNCIAGAKRPLYAYNNPNNIPFWDIANPNEKRPGYNADCGFADGPQDDIFDGASSGGNSPASSQSVTTSGESASSTTGGTAAPGKPSADANTGTSSPSPSSSPPTSTSSSSPDSRSGWIIGGVCVVIVVVVAGAVMLGRRKRAQADGTEEKQALKPDRRLSTSSGSSHSSHSSSDSDID
ncbi:hypothetical protein JCM6882_001760 [Rhodosporidiobolus microsporus]